MRATTVGNHSYINFHRTICSKGLEETILSLLDSFEKQEKVKIINWFFHTEGKSSAFYDHYASFGDGIWVTHEPITH